MCIILDANQKNSFIDLNNDDMEPVRKIIEAGDLKIVYAKTSKFQREYGKAMWSRLLRYRVDGQAVLFSNEQIDTEIKKLGKIKKIKSDDNHILALARISGAKLLITEDEDLIKDFKDGDIVGGHIYKRKSHHHLLRGNVCPASG